MSEGKNDGGPAFPGTEGTPPNQVGWYGMSLRDWFAGNCPITMSEFASAIGGVASGEASVIMDAYCALRYQYADAMLRAREANP